MKLSYKKNELEALIRYSVSRSNKDYNECYKLINALIMITIYKYSSNNINNEDLIQDLHINVIEWLNNVRDKHTVIGYLMTCLRNKVFYINNKSKNIDSKLIIVDSDSVNLSSIIDNDCNSIDRLVDSDLRNEQRVRIINGLNSKIIDLKLANRKNSEFIELMRDYLIMNDFDANGMRDYIIEKLPKMSKYYCYTANKFGIKTMNLEDNNNSKH